MIDTLGFRLREQIQDNGNVLGSWISVSNLVHEIAYMQEPNGEKGKLHHLCYWYGIPQNLYDIAESYVWKCLNKAVLKVLYHVKNKLYQC